MTIAVVLAGAMPVVGIAAFIGGGVCLSFWWLLTLPAILTYEPLNPLRRALTRWFDWRAGLVLFGLGFACFVATGFLTTLAAGVR